MPESIPGTEGAQSITAVVRPRTILIKYGGNAMLDPQLVDGVLARLVAAHHGGMHVVLVHGGGPYIARRLEQQGLESRFIDGQRVTGADVMAVVSMVLCGEVNGRIVSDLQRLGAPAVGICGRDGNTCSAEPLLSPAGLGQVGIVGQMDPALIRLLLDGRYLPVVAPVSPGPDGSDYNINADMFAGSLAAALGVDEYLVLTDVDGLYRNWPDEGSLVDGISAVELEGLLAGGISGGMIPKLRGCIAAVRGGARSARIINGTRPEALQAALDGAATGTVIREKQ
ncbi:MAG: acetylglutamate kinase [Planctomycetales bacterium]|nr:acetylglutamate kinase [bacterium]UNM07157.1 MAG: acetylglutamate kinase [Planctomycetales bacterium]